LSLYEIEVTPSIAEDKLQAKLAGDWAKLKRRRPPSSKPTTSRGHPSPSNHTTPVASGPAVSTKVGIYGDWTRLQIKRKKGKKGKKGIFYFIYRYIPLQIMYKILQTSISSYQNMQSSRNFVCGCF
jgi:hypothetical protein